jgi:bacterioferritin (cytochrome b1)
MQEVHAECTRLERWTTSWHRYGLGSIPAHINAAGEEAHIARGHLASRSRFTPKATMDMLSEAATSIDRLNYLLRSELAAVDSYDRAAVMLGDVIIPELGENRDCHFKRSQELNAAITAMDGEPAVSSGAWGGLSDTATEGVLVLGRTDIIGILTTGEDRGLADYRSMRLTADDRVRPIITRDLLPAQERTHHRIRLLSTNAIPAKPTTPTVPGLTT